MVARSRRHHSPVIKLELLRSRTFSGAFAASFLYYAGFGAFVLSSVEFLTGVWGYSSVRAGLAIAPGPAFARLVAPRLAVRLGGVGRVAVVGCAVGAAAQLLWLTSMTPQPAYLTHLLPAQLLGCAEVAADLAAHVENAAAGLPSRRPADHRLLRGGRDHLGGVADQAAGAGAGTGARAGTGNRGMSSRARAEAAPGGV